MHTSTDNNAPHGSNLDFLLTDELIHLGKIVRGFIAKELPRDKVRLALPKEAPTASVNTSFELANWKQFSDLGVIGAMLPETLGGLGLGLLGASVLLENASISINQLPIFQTIAHAILPIFLAQYNPAATLTNLNQVLAQILQGDLVASGFDCEYPTLQGSALALSLPNAKTLGTRISGSFSPIIGGVEIGVLFVLCKHPTRNDTTMYLLNLPRNPSSHSESSFSLNNQTSFDLLRPYSTLTCDNLELSNTGAILDNYLIDPLCEPGLCEQAHKRQNSLSTYQLCQAILASAELIGLASASLRMSLDYTRTRRQFSRPISSFQAIQHQLADMHVIVEQGRALNRIAADKFDKLWNSKATASHDKTHFTSKSDHKQVIDGMLAAKAFCSENMPRVIEQAIQAHGGIGFTYEHDLHLYLRRAKCQALQYGDPLELNLLLGYG